MNQGTNTPFGALKQVDAGLLHVGYAEAGLVMAGRLSSCTGGLTTFTAMPRSPRYWQRRGTG